jgi:hypothetical protein
MDFKDMKTENAERYPYQFAAMARSVYYSSEESDKAKLEETGRPIL